MGERDLERLSDQALRYWPRSMGRLAVAAGTTLLRSGFPVGGDRLEVETEFGPIALLDTGEMVVLHRHGLDSYSAPHAIDHRANLSALAASGCDRVLAIGSCGSLRAELGVGTFLAPDDFVAPQLGISLFDDARGHLIAGFDPDWRRRVISAWREHVREPLRERGVYRQMPGPRFETEAEVRMLAAHADVVGMTLASECVIARELGLAYAAICVVDNLANGVGERPLSVTEFEAGVVANRGRAIAALEAICPALASENG
jgi:5'-methylthioadenosine phosphorylase